MAHRGLGLARLPARQAEFPVAAPVAGCFPAVLLHQGPAFAHPQLRAPVAAIGDEGRVFPIGHQLAGDGKGLQPLAVPGRFVVEMEVVAAGVVADLHKPPRVGKPLGGAIQPALLIGGFRFGVVHGLEGIAAEAIEQIHQQQLLVLLFVLQAQLQQGAPGLLRQPMGRERGDVEQLLEGPIHPLPPGQDLRDRRPAQQAALGPGMAGANGVVVAVEQVAPAGIGGLNLAEDIRKAGFERCVLEQKGFKEPGGVAQVPFGRAGIGHPLEAKVLGGEGGDQGNAVPADRLKARQQSRGLGGAGVPGCRHQPPKVRPDPIDLAYDPATANCLGRPAPWAAVRPGSPMALWVRWVTPP